MSYSDQVDACPNCKMNFEKRIKELELKLERMKCCDNCLYVSYHYGEADCTIPTMIVDGQDVWPCLRVRWDAWHQHLKKDLWEMKI
jgi:hypothetical protein